MIPILFEHDETEFLSNGIGRLVDCLRFESTEERDGIFEVEFDYPVTGRLYSEIVEGRIVYGLHDASKVPQPFDIYGRSAPLDGVVTFYAHHVSYRLQYAILQPFTAASCAATMATLAGKSITPCPFEFWTDKTTTGNFKVEAPVSIKEILGGVQGSILDVFGTGEYEWDKFTVKLHLHRGRDTGIQIRYGKNLTDLTQDVDTSGFYSAVVPYWLGGDNNDTLVTLPEWVVQSTAASGGLVPSKAVPLDLSDQWQEPPTETQLRGKALERVNSAEAWLPEENIKVDFLALWQTEEYESIAPLEQVQLCDRVGVVVPALGLVAENVQVVKTRYEGLGERYISMELGSARTSFASVVQAAAEKAILPQVPTKSYLQAKVDKLSAEINAGTDGIIVDIMNANGQRSEILILCDEGATEDTPPEQCQHIWRINKAGIAYSSDYGQTYNLAITASGEIVADFITAGTMNANIIKAGVLSSVNGRVYFDLQGNTLVCSRMQSPNPLLGDAYYVGAYDLVLETSEIADSDWSTTEQFNNLLKLKIYRKARNGSGGYVSRDAYGLTFELPWKTDGSSTGGTNKITSKAPIDITACDGASGVSFDSDSAGIAGAETTWFGHPYSPVNAAGIVASHNSSSQKVKVFGDLATDKIVPASNNTNNRIDVEGNVYITGNLYINGQRVYP